MGFRNLGGVPESGAFLQRRGRRVDAYRTEQASVDHQAVVGAVELDGVVDGADQFGSVLGNKRQYRVQTLLQCTFRIDESVERRGISCGTLIAAQRFAAGLLRDLFQLIADLLRAAVERFGERRIERR